MITSLRWRADPRCRQFALLAGVVMVVGLAGCGAPRGGYGTATSECAPALPPARAVVHDRGTLVLVRPVGHREWDELFPNRAAASESTASAAPTPAPPAASSHLAIPPGQAGPQPRACLVVYQGPFAAGSVPAAPAGGKYAVIGIALRTASVVGVTTTDVRPPQHPPAHPASRAPTPH